MIKQKLFDELIEQGASECGVVRARKFSELFTILEKRGRVSLCESDIEKRINPFLLMSNAKSIVVCLFSYCIGEKGRISRYAMGEDYHKVVINALEKGCEILKQNGFSSKAYADNSPLLERYLAYLAGLGFFGKNGMLINEKYGSFVFVGYILTDCEMPCDTPLDNSMCIGCNKCIDACPGNALGEDFSFNENKCVSYLTQKKGELTGKEQEIIKKSGYIWGCDICQNVCPYNYTAQRTNIPQFFKNLVFDIEIDENMSNSEFGRKFSNRAFAWRGKNVLKRNIELFK